MRRALAAGGTLVAVAIAAACSGGDDTTPPAGDAGADGPVASPPIISVVSRDDRFVVREHMLAGLEMQLSGEPFAEAMGRDLTRYSRDFRPPDIYFDPSLDGFGPFLDPAGFASAIESYEYSKQPMNELAFESGAGISLAYAPLIDTAQAGGTAACSALRDVVQSLGAASNATSRFVHAQATPENPLGWPGIWPTMEPFVSFDPTIAPTNSVSLACSITSDDDPGASGGLLSDDYECDATTLHLVDRANQVDAAISPGSSGWAGWKSALWIINYLQSMHDAAETAVTQVDEADLAQVGAPGNAVLAKDDGAVAGTYLGSSDIEGFQAGLMLSELDNEAQDWLTERLTGDGTALGGFKDLAGALAYDANAPLLYFPAEIAVTEATDPDCEFPRPSAYAVRTPGSRLLDLSGLLGAYASLYALTDQANAEVGGSQAVRAYFDGDPFPADDQIADGEPTLHDRALAMIRVALVDLARMHRDPASGLPVDDASVSGGQVTRGTTLSAVTAAYALLALRTTRRALSDQLSLYGNNKPDTATVTTPLDAPPIATTPKPEVVTEELNSMVAALANLFYDHLTDASGRAWPGWDVAKGAVTSDDDVLDAHTAAVRGLLLGYLATGDTRLRDRALAVYQRVEAKFYDPSARLYRPTPGDTSDTVEFGVMRFALLQAMLRDTYELIGVRAGQEDLAAQIEDRVGRLDKLLLNGWDDRNGNKGVDWPAECIQVVDGLPRGGLQMAERTLTGETGTVADKSDAGPRKIATDREPDCVPEISAAGRPSALADSIVLKITKVGP